MFYKKTVLNSTFLNIHRKIPVFESLFKEVAGLQVGSFIKRDCNTGVFQ